MRNKERLLIARLNGKMVLVRVLANREGFEILQEQSEGETLAEFETRCTRPEGSRK